MYCINCNKLILLKFKNKINKILNSGCNNFIRIEFEIYVFGYLCF